MGVVLYSPQVELPPALPKPAIYRQPCAHEDVMKAEILMIGTELLLGQIHDTNATEMGRILAENGIPLYQKTTIGDNQERIVRALDHALDRADVILTSGGLGPTEDDLTRESVSQLLDRPLELRQDLLDYIASLFKRFGRPMPDNNKKQAMVPRGGRPIDNPNGTAPGLIIEHERGTIICMPGVPRELFPMLQDHVLPYIKERYKIRGAIHSRVLKVCGVGESRVDELMGDLMRTYENPKIGVLASIDAVRIRISAMANSKAEADAMIAPVENSVRERLPGLIMGTDGDTIEGVVDELLKKREWTLAVGETDTGGMIGQRLTAHGAESFMGALVLPTDTFDGQANESAALNFAEDVRSHFRATCGLALAHVPGTERTWCAFVTPNSSKTWEVSFPGKDDRRQGRLSGGALEQIRRVLTGSVAV
jgi:nicotinamide-nucleotide amidase